MLKSLFNLLPISGLVLKAQLPQYIVKKHAGFGVCRKQARQVLQGIARVALKFCVCCLKCFAVAPLKQRGCNGVNVVGVYPGKLL